MAAPTTILISGSTGFIGSAAATHFQSAGHTILRLSRSPGKNAVSWQPLAGRMDALPDHVEAVVHLAGENIFGRWTKRKKERIYASRVHGTTLLADHIAAMKYKPKVLICASAVGYYGDSGDAILTEQSPPGDGFLSRVCRDWETAAESARQAGIRTVHLRLGMVLDKNGGALAAMLPVFKLGLGGVLGGGTQWVSWISRADVIRIIDFAIQTETLSGPVNAVSPQPVQNRLLTRTLGRLLHRPTFLSAPAAVLRLGLGDFAQETLLASSRAVPEQLLKAGFVFTHPTLEEAVSAAIS